MIFSHNTHEIFARARYITNPTNPTLPQEHFVEYFVVSQY